MSPTHSGPHGDSLLDLVITGKDSSPIDCCCFTWLLHPGEPLVSALVSLMQCLKASIELSERTGIDDVGHCLNLATVTQVVGCLSPSFEASPALALCWCGNGLGDTTDDGGGRNLATYAMHSRSLSHGLCLNPNKSEAILLGTLSATRHSDNPLTVNIAGAIIPVSPTLKSLGVTLDSQLSFHQHVNSVCKISYFHLRSMRHVRSCLPPLILRTVACSIISAKLDYCNSLLYGTTLGNIHKLQLVQNSLARLVTGTRKFDHISPVLAKLHWLPVSYRITYKIAVLTHKTLSTSQPGYLSSSIHRHHLPDTVITTRSATLNHLTLPNIRNFRSDFSRRGFANCAPTIWNNLPKDITDNTITRDVFVKRLKTHLYRLAYVD